MFQDMEELCQIYIDKINYNDNLQALQEQSDSEDIERGQLIAMIQESSIARELPKNFLEQSISLVERSSLKLCPVIKEVRKRLVGSAQIDGNKKSQNQNEESKEEDGGEKNKHQTSSGSPNKTNGDEDEDMEEEKPDMRSVLGFLN